MRTMNFQNGNVTPNRKSQELSARTTAGTVAPGQKARKPVPLDHGHQEWKQRIEGDWQSHLETLQRYVSELARRNRQLRTALVTASVPKGGYGNAVNI